MRSLIAKIENDQIEAGLQLRDNDPTTPVENQIWINTTTKKTSYYSGMIHDLNQGYIEGDAPFDVIELVGSNIDWSIGKIFKIENTSGIFNITMSNQINGESRYLMLVSDSLLPTTITLNSSINIDLNDNYSLPSGEGIVIEFNRINNIDYAKVIFNGSIASFPSGASGDLVINNGQTFTIPAGSTVDYNSITINSGGILDIIGDTNGSPVIIGINGDLIVNGTIRGTNLNSAFNSWSTSTPNGENITFEIQGRSGGGFRGDPSLTGHGSGGNGGTGYTYGGGQGGIGGGNGSAPPSGGGQGGGVGNSTLGNGNNGSTGSAPAGGRGGNGGGSGGGTGGGGGGVYWYGGGGGGGGGHRGRHGRALYIYCRGNITGSGTINLNGQNGFNGGNGGNGGGGQSGSQIGQQGGGGAGGSGGNLWIRSQSFDVSYTISNGNGGTGFSSGQSGLSGTFDFEQI